MVKLVVTVDTEEDNAWSPDPSRRCDNVAHIPRFQELCARYGYPVTYLVTHDVAKNEGAVKTLASCGSGGGAEIGAHLHPWSTPPETLPSPEDGPFFRPFPYEYDENTLQRMCANLTDAVAASFGRRPTAYRAGRFGLDGVGARMLSNLGYEVDSSVTPGVDWRMKKGRPGGRGGPDFRSAPVLPYYPSVTNLNEPGDGELLEVPVTILFTRWPFLPGGFAEKLWGRCTESELAQRLARRGGLARSWLRPFPHYGPEVLPHVLDAAHRSELPVAVMMIHSSELMPGGSPYWPDRDAIETLYERLEGLFRHAAARGVEGETLTGFARGMKKGRSVGRTSRPGD